jgi:hypothetical protein
MRIMIPDRGMQRANAAQVQPRIQRWVGLLSCAWALVAGGEGHLISIARAEPSVRKEAVASSPTSVRSEVPAHNRAELTEPPPRPEPGDLEEKARALFAAIQQDKPELASNFFFPRDAFLLVKAIPDPGKYWDKLFARYQQDIHALHRSLPQLEHAEYERFELVKRGGWVKVKEEGNHLPYWVSRHSFLHYRVGQKREKLEVRVLITWDDHWYVTHLSEFH